MADQEQEEECQWRSCRTTLGTLPSVPRLVTLRPNVIRDLPQLKVGGAGALPVEQERTIPALRQKHWETSMSYRNKTYVAFASEDIRSYRLMEAWRDNQHIEFSFYDAHDLYISLDTSKPETIKNNLRQRLKNAKQVVLLGSRDAKRKGGDGQSFLAHEIEVILEFELPVVIANLDQDRTIDMNFIPTPMANYHSMSVSFQPKIIMYALDNYADGFSPKQANGPRYYLPTVYTKLGL